MDIKKYLQQKAEEDVSSVLSEEDKEYCKAIVLESKFNNKRAGFNRKFWVPFSCAVCVLLAAVIAIAIIFAPRTSPIRYFDDKIVSQISTQEEANKDSKYFNVTHIENTSCEFSMSYDSDSGDKLYYEVNFKGFFENSHLVIVVNKNYQYPFEKPENGILTEKLSGYTLNYFVDENFDSVEYSGWISLKTETVYINYTQVVELGDDAFFTYVQSVIQAK